jgi:DNA mismatch repair ATPase MutS
MLEAETGESVISVFSINLERSKFGASLFSEGDVYIMPTDSTGIHRDMIEKLLIQKNEIKILSSTRSNISQLKSCLPSEVSIQLLPASSFFCCNAAEIQDRYGIVMPLDLSEDNESSFKSLNALLSYISNSQPNIELANIKVLLMQVDSCDVAISKSSLQALQIFDFEPHPSLHASNYDFKEGCSIFSIFNQVASEEGREKLRNWFQNPTRNQQILKERQESIGVLLQSEMSFFKDSAVKALKKCIRFKVTTMWYRFQFNKHIHFLEHSK